MIVNTIDTYYRTFDLNLAAALVSKNFLLVSLNKGNPRMVQFAFKRKKGLDIDNVVDKYYADQLQVEARMFADNIKMLKSRIYSEG